MKLQRIFDKNGQHLHSVCIGKSKENEWEVLFNKLTNPAYIRNFCKENLDHLLSGFYGRINLEDAQNEIRREAISVFTDFLEIPKKGSNKKLDELFAPLDNDDISDSDLKKMKAKPNKRVYPKSKIRIYAIRISKNCYVVTGGAIKVVGEMKHHPATKSELEKINRVKDWLKLNNIISDDDLNYYYEYETEKD